MKKIFIWPVYRFKNEIRVSFFPSKTIFCHGRWEKVGKTGINGIYRPKREKWLPMYLLMEKANFFNNQYFRNSTSYSSSPWNSENFDIQYGHFWTVLGSFEIFPHFSIWIHVNFKDCSILTVLPTYFLRIWWRIRIWTRILKILSFKEVVSNCPKSTVFPISSIFPISHLF